MNKVDQALWEGMAMSLVLMPKYPEKGRAKRPNYEKLILGLVGSHAAVTGVLQRICDLAEEINAKGEVEVSIESLPQWAEDDARALSFHGEDD